MPRLTNRKCQKCAFFQIDESREQSCWIEGKCNNTRNYYRHREKKLENKKKSYAVATGKIAPQKFTIVPDTYRAELVIYGKMPNKLRLVNGGVKAIKVNVYQGSNLAFESDVTRTVGMVQRDLEALIEQVLVQLNEQFQIKNFGEIIWKSHEN
ncbi:MAG: hypothetical protein RLZZ574_1546 [Cyanobacteriota bacterium]|jgi:hypothetical protein